MCEAIINSDPNFVNDGELMKLPKTKKKNGYSYKLVKRNSLVAMYSLHNETYPEDTSISFEVFVITNEKPYKLKQKSGKKSGLFYHYPASEKFPGNEDFGNIAWSFNTEEKALKKFEELLVRG